MAGDLSPVHKGEARLSGSAYEITLADRVYIVDDHLERCLAVLDLRALLDLGDVEVLQILANGKI